MRYVQNVPVSGDFIKGGLKSVTLGTCLRASLPVGWMVLVPILGAGQGWYIHL